MNNQISKFDLLEANLMGLRARVPDLPLTGILLFRLLMDLSRHMGAMLEEQIRPFGMAEVEFRVLMTLFSQPDGMAHPGDLCVPASQSPANMSRISDALVSRDLITRVLSVQDRRRMVLQITAHGEELVRRLLPQMFVPVREMLQSLPQPEQRELIIQLKRLRHSISKRPRKEPAGAAP